MNLGFYSGVAGMGAFQEKLNVTGNNIANANTNAYKAPQVSFQNLLYSRMFVNEAGEPVAGVGSRAVYNGLDMTQGGAVSTNSELDYMIAGDGFFAVDHNGTREYTRDGAFQPAIDGTNFYLADNTGAYVLDPQGQRIRLERDEKTGTFLNVADRLGVFHFDNPEALQPLSSNRYLPSAQSGAAALAADESYRLMPYMLERSGVSLVDEMSNMITAQRGFQLSARFVQSADQIEDIVNNLRT